MKKGFTLVELLAVIVILSIIAIITIPMISNVIEKSKLGAMEDSAYGLIEAANYYYAEHMNEMSSNKLFVIENGNQTSEEKLNYKGKIEGNAKVLLASNGKVALCLTNGKSYAKKEITDTKVVMNTVSSDTTCEINGIDNDSDITIDISGSNSSYYNKNEIDDKLNDIRNDLSDLSNAVSNNTTAIDNLNDSLNSLNGDLESLFMNPKVIFDETGWTTPTVYSGRATSVKGGYKIIGNICYVNVSFILKYSQSSDTSSTFFTEMPAISDNDYFTQFFTVVSPRGNSALISLDSKTSLDIGGYLTSGLHVSVKGFYKVAQ